MDRKSQFTILDVTSLTFEEAKALFEDVVEIQAEMDCGFTTAEATLTRRIGGQGNLRSYVDCLMVGR